MSRYLWTGSAATLAFLLLWQFSSDGRPHNLAYGVGLLLVSPHLWTRPFELFRPMREEFEASLSRPPAPVAVVASAGIGLALIIGGAALRWLAA